MKKCLLILSFTATVLTGCKYEFVKPPPQKYKPTVQEETVITEPKLETEVMIDNTHNAQNSLDWNGTYRGIVPCADCDGLEINVTLNTNGSYSLDQAYLGKGEERHYSEGSFNWDKSGRVITLNDEKESNQYFVAENELIKLDSNGQHMTDDVGNQYKLLKK
uniref:Lipoprotein n=2 Tax=Vibrio TaxID=662 RepID=A0A0H3ZTW7_9VIBR|nr:Lipoprotein [Vibrio cyclitrophicus]AKN38281.1 hypothetical protein [Vibrio splendidus]